MRKGDPIESRLLVVWLWVNHYWGLGLEPEVEDPLLPIDESEPLLEFLCFLCFLEVVLPFWSVLDEPDCPMVLPELPDWPMLLPEFPDWPMLLLEFPDWPIVDLSELPD